jgi:hypothetical protein
VEDATAHDGVRQGQAPNEEQPGKAEKKPRLTLKEFGGIFTLVDA